MSLFIEHIACYDRKLSKSPFNNQIRYLIYRERTRYISSLSLSFLSVSFVCYAKKKKQNQKHKCAHTAMDDYEANALFNLIYLWEN